MIYVNGKKMDWHRRIKFSEIFTFLGYTISKPLVITRVNGKLVRKQERKDYLIPDNSVIEVLNLLRGG